MSTPINLIKIFPKRLKSNKIVHSDPSPSDVGSPVEGSNIDSGFKENSWYLVWFFLPNLKINCLK
jgi:hypothetical protein